MERLASKIPSEIIENCILPYCSMAWLNVSKKWNQTAVNNIVNDPKALKIADQLLKSAILSQNYTLAAVLIRDPRYTDLNALATAIGAAWEDKRANMILLRRNEVLPDQRIFLRAIKLNWLDVIHEIISRNLLQTIIIPSTDSILKTITPEALELFIEDPKLEPINVYTFNAALDNNNPKIAEMCLRAKRIDLYDIVHKHGRRTHLLDAILKTAKLYEPENIKALWEAIGHCDHTRLDTVKKIITDYKLDPSAESNYGLRVAVMNCSELCTSIVELLLNYDTVILALEPYEINPLVIAMKEGKRAATQILIEHPKINVKWIDNILIYFLKDNDSPYGLEIINRKYKHLVTKKKLLDQIPAKISKIRQQIRGYEFFYEPDYWSDDDST